jgi:hypothetical protein
MILRSVHALLLLAALVGAFLAIQAGREHQLLRAEHRRLKAEVGLLSVTDPDKMHVVAIPTGDPLHFAWQVYVPAICGLRWKASYGNGGTGGSSSGNAEPYFDLLRVRIRERKDGSPEIWFKRRSGSSLVSVSPRDVEMIKQGEATIEQLAAEQTAVVDSQQVYTLLWVREQNALEKEPLINIRFGTPEAFQKELERGDSEP